jgi:chromosome segregation ATPase
MNETTNDQMSPPQTGKLKGKGKLKGGALDRTFIPAWLLGSVILVVIILTVLSGWKIVNLEMERVEVASERSLLERDIQAYASIQKELPALEERQQAWTKEFNELEGKVQTARTRLESLTIQAEAEQLSRDKAKAELTTAQVDTQTNRKVYADLQSKIQTARSQSQRLTQQVESLGAQEETLRRSTGQLQKKAGELQADISKLEKERKNKQQVLELMARDTSELKTLSKRFDDIAKNMELSNQEVNETLKGLNEQTKELTQAVEVVSSNAKDISSQVQLVSNEVGNLKIADATSKPLVKRFNRRLAISKKRKPT